MFTSILFDKDGCLLDFDKTWGAWACEFLSVISEGDAELTHRLAARIGFDFERGTFDPESPIIAGTPDEGVTLLSPLLPNWEFEDLLAFSNESAARAILQPVVPLAPLLMELGDRGIKLGIATNDSEATARAHMESLKVAAYFDLILGSDSGYGSKPDHGMQSAFLNGFDLEAKHGIMVGDSLHDLQSGRAAGMVCVGVLTGPANRSDLEPAADVVLPDISHLPAWMADHEA
ncbi:MAG: HAD family hydrolase [Litoreibacter sp.]